MNNIMTDFYLNFIMVVLNFIIGIQYCSNYTKDTREIVQNYFTTIL